MAGERGKQAGWPAQNGVQAIGPGAQVGDAPALEGGIRHLGAAFRLRAQAFWQRLRQDWAAEVDSGRLMLWLPVAMAIGTLLYFGAAHEPSLIVSWGAAGVLALCAGLARNLPKAFVILLVLAAMALGFALAASRTAWVTHDSVIDPPPFPVRLTGHVERVEQRATSDRIVLRLDPGPVDGLTVRPERVRLTLRKGTAPPVGTHVRQLVRLQPPLQPAMPGAHDFGRNIWFDGIGALGFGLGAPQILPAAPQTPLSIRMAEAVSDVRAALAAHIRASLHGQTAAIAVALVTGERAAISPQIEESMRVSGLTHILSISGLHMAMVAGTLFAIVRGLLALFPPLALRWPIKSMAALVALAGSAFYLILSGNEVPAQRSFVMTALVLVGIMAGRRALTLRTVGVALLIVLVAMPEALLEPGMQMSFAATLALVAGYESLRPLRARPRWEGWGARVLILPLMFLAGIALTSLLAGAATAPYAAYHFQRAASWGLLANLAAMPAVSLLVMPFGLIGVLLIPFGWDGLAWPVMGAGIEIMVAVSDWCAALPGADIPVDWVNATCLLWLTLALLCASLLQGTLKLAAVPPLAVAIYFASAPPLPDVLVAPNARTVAVRGTDGQLSILNARSNRLFASQWLSREGDRRPLDTENLAAAFDCDPLGCSVLLRDGRRLAVSRNAASLEADCLNAAIVVSEHMPPADCPARVITRARLERTGTLALFHTPEGWRENETRTALPERPWSPAAGKAPRKPSSSTDE